MTLALKLQKQHNSIGTALTGLIPSRNNSESFRISGKQLESPSFPGLPSLASYRLGALSKTTVPPSLPPGAAWWASCMPGGTRRHPGGSQAAPGAGQCSKSANRPGLSHIWLTSVRGPSRDLLTCCNSWLTPLYIHCHCTVGRQHCSIAHQWIRLKYIHYK